MTDMSDSEDVKDRLWKEIDKGRYGMLGLVCDDPPQHFQPMTAYCEEEHGRIWFFTRKETDLARTLGDGGGKMAMFTLSSKDQDLQACLSGRLWLDHDNERMERFWNPVVAAWYPEGKDDPQLTMLRFEPEDASVWLSDAGPIRFAYEIAKANAAKRPPHVGGRAEVRLN